MTYEQNGKPPGVIRSCPRCGIYMSEQTPGEGPVCITCDYYRDPSLLELAWDYASDTLRFFADTLDFFTKRTRAPGSTHFRVTPEPERADALLP